ncbi:MAG: hypothetical protein ACOY16_12835 [Chloroflexota bacterium]
MTVDKNQAAPCCANFLARSILESFTEELGRAEMALVLQSAGLIEFMEIFPPDNLEKDIPLEVFGRFFNALHKQYDERSCRGLIQRAGRSCFYRLYRRSTPSLGLASLDFLTLPKSLKVRKGAQLVAEYFRTFADLNVHAGGEGSDVHWRMEYRLLDEFHPGYQFMPDLFLGFWHEALYSISGGKTFLFEHFISNQENEFQSLIRIPSSPID